MWSANADYHVENRRPEAVCEAGNSCFGCLGVGITFQTARGRSSNIYVHNKNEKIKKKWTMTI